MNKLVLIKKVGVANECAVKKRSAGAHCSE